MMEKMEKETLRGIKEPEHGGCPETHTERKDRAVLQYS